MTGSSGAALSVTANLRLVADGCNATIEADGHELTLRTKDVGALLARALDSTRMLPGGAIALRATISQLGAVLQRAGLSARLVGPSGTVVAIGHHHGSRAGRTLLGSDKVSMGSVPALASAVLGVARASAPIRRKLLYPTAGAAVAALLTAAGLRSRRARK